VLVEVVRLRRNGLRLRASELDPPVRGTLRISWTQTTSQRRSVLVANVYEHYGTSRQRPLLLTIGDVVLQPLEDAWLSLAGTELSAHRVEGDPRFRVTEHRQVWRCSPIHEHGPSLWAHD